TALFDVPLCDLLANVAATIDAHDAYMRAQLARNGIDLLRGRARFISKDRISLRRADGGEVVLCAPRILIATGSRPRAPDGIAVDHEHVLDSDSILSLPYLPRSLLVYGSGVIATEYASIFAALGCRVVQVDRSARPLAFADAELVDIYVQDYVHHGGEYLAATALTACHWDGTSQVACTLADGRRITVDKVLVAAGRVANVEGLGLEAIGVELGARGHIVVDDTYATRVPGVYAAGDVIGPPSLASVSMEQGRRAACHALGLLAATEFGAAPPTGIYTIPEIATVGSDEATVRRHLGGARVGRARFAEIARGQIAGAPRGLLKLVADPDGRKVLGVQIVGDGSAELVHVGQMGIAAAVDVDAFVDTVFNFPTMAEAYRVAALDVARQRRTATGNEWVAAAVGELL
ncbi:MAG: FAD-dependent oxidoreductase, partial [Steroidobacteraceae bacterium]|nr:FAD-dependent oxidoreductase [Steroidobacteraceae bacterium]MDW8260444.1 FAD-dependent oxidoreductase [Gammaproteobacteria bacterium]